MAKNKNVKEVETLNNEILKEEVQSKMAAAPEEEETKVSFAEKHPKLAKAGKNGKKILKGVGLGVAAVITIVVSNKLGKATGYKEGIEAGLASNGSNPEAIPEEIPQVEEEIPVVEEVTTTEF